MPAGMTSTSLPASRVADAADWALTYLRVERADLKVKCENEWIAQYRKAHKWRTMFYGNAELRALVPPGTHAISELYRVGDEATILAIKDIAIAASEANANLTVEVTADDFRLLSPYYIKKGKFK